MLYLGHLGPDHGFHCTYTTAQFQGYTWVIRVLFFNQELHVADHYLRPLSHVSESHTSIDQYLTAMVSRRSPFNRNGLVAVQLLPAMV